MLKVINSQFHNFNHFMCPHLELLSTTLSLDLTVKDSSEETSTNIKLDKFTKTLPKTAIVLHPCSPSTTDS